MPTREFSLWSLPFDLQHGRFPKALEFRGEPPADLATLDGESFRYDTADSLVRSAGTRTAT